MNLPDPLPADQLRRLGQTYFAAPPKGGFREPMARALRVEVDTLDAWLAGRRQMRGPVVALLDRLIDDRTSEPPGFASLLD